MKKIFHHAKRHATHVVKHLHKHRHKYVGGLFAGFAVVKTFVLLAGFIGGLSFLSNHASAAGESFCMDNSGLLDVPVVECQMLVDLYNTTNGQTRFSNNDWLNNTTVGNRYGVTVSDGHVTAIDLSNNYNGNNLDGALTDLSALSSLSSLNLYGNSSLMGDYTALSGLTQLTYLNTDRTHIGGDISNFSQMITMGNLSLSNNLFDYNSINTSIYGDISSLANLENLKELWIRNTAVEGDIAVFGNMSNVQIISADQTNIYGDVGIFSSKTNVRIFYANSTDVTGDIASFALCSGLQSLGVSNTDVYGDIAIFQNTPNISWVQVDKTTIGGDISVLSGKNSLRGFGAEDNNLSGDLSVFSSATGMEQLMISNSTVGGTLDSLSGMTNLRRLKLNSNRIEGVIPADFATTMSHLEGVAKDNTINSNFIDIDQSYPQSLTDFLDNNFQRRTQNIHTEFAFTNNAFILGGSDNIEKGFVIDYNNKGPRDISGAKLFVAISGDITISNYASTGAYGKIYGVPGDPCYDDFMDNTSSGVYYAALDSSINSAFSIDFYTLATMLSQIAGKEDGVIDYTGQRHETEGQRMMTAGGLCNLFGQSDFSTCMSTLGQQIGVPMNVETIGGDSCGTGGTLGYIYDLPAVISADTTGTITITGTIPAGMGKTYELNASLIFPANYADFDMNDNTISLSYTTRDPIYRNLTIQKTLLTEGPYTPGMQVQYQIDFTNIGESVIDVAGITDTPDAGLSLVSMDEKYTKTTPAKIYGITGDVCMDEFLNETGPYMIAVDQKIHQRYTSDPKKYNRLDGHTDDFYNFMTYNPDPEISGLFMQSPRNGQFDMLGEFSMNLMSMMVPGMSRQEAMMQYWDIDVTTLDPKCGGGRSYYIFTLNDLGTGQTHTTTVTMTIDANVVEGTTLTNNVTANYRDDDGEKSASTGVSLMVSPILPIASNVAITGELSIGSTLTGSYTYSYNKTPVWSQLGESFTTQNGIGKKILAIDSNNVPYMIYSSGDSNSVRKYTNVFYGITGDVCFDQYLNETGPYMVASDIKINEIYQTYSGLRQDWYTGATMNTHQMYLYNPQFTGYLSAPWSGAFNQLAEYLLYIHSNRDPLEGWREIGIDITSLDPSCGVVAPYSAWAQVGGEFSGKSVAIRNLVLDNHNVPYLIYNASDPIAGSNYSVVQKFESGTRIQVGEEFTGKSVDTSNLILDNNNVPYIIYIGSNPEGGSVYGVVQKFESDTRTQVGTAFDGKLGHLVLDNNNVPYMINSSTNIYGEPMYSVQKFASGARTQVGEEFSGQSVSINNIVLDNNNVPYIIYNVNNPAIGSTYSTVQKFESGVRTQVGGEFTSQSVSISNLVLDNNNVPYVIYRDQKAAAETIYNIQKYVSSARTTVGESFTGGSINISNLILGSNNVPHIIYSDNDPIGGNTYRVQNFTSPIEGESSYQRYRGAGVITGATNKTYTLTPADVGQTIVFEVIPKAIDGVLGVATQSKGLLIAPAHDITISKTLLTKGAILPGSNVQYRIDITNGGADIINPVITEAPGVNLSLVSIDEQYKTNTLEKEYGVTGDVCYDEFLNETGPYMDVFDADAHNSFLLYSGFFHDKWGFTGDDMNRYQAIYYNPEMHGFLQAPRYGQFNMIAEYTLSIFGQYYEGLNFQEGMLSGMNTDITQMNSCGTGGHSSYVISLPHKLGSGETYSTTVTMKVASTAKAGDKVENTVSTSYDGVNDSYTHTLTIDTAVTPIKPSLGGGPTGPSVDVCKLGDCTKSYYDKMCGVCPTKPTETIIDTLLKQLHGAPELQGSIAGSPYSQETNFAYMRAYNAGITTMPTIQQANIEGKLTRAHMAKMLVNYADKILEKPIDTGMNCSFTDMAKQSEEMQYYAKVACELGLMGLSSDGTPATKFNPTDEVTRAQFGTVLSRALYGTLNNEQKGTQWYAQHLQALKNAGIMKKIETPTMKELRGNVFIMLQRASK